MIFLQNFSAFFSVLHKIPTLQKIKFLVNTYFCVSKCTFFSCFSKVIYEIGHVLCPFFDLSFKDKKFK